MHTCPLHPLVLHPPRPVDGSRADDRVRDEDCVGSEESGVGAEKAEPAESVTTEGSWLIALIVSTGIEDTELPVGKPLFACWQAVRTKKEQSNVKSDVVISREYTTDVPARKKMPVEFHLQNGRDFEKTLDKKRSASTIPAIFVFCLTQKCDNQKTLDPVSRRRFSSARKALHHQP